MRQNPLAAHPPAFPNLPRPSILSLVREPGEEERSALGTAARLSSLGLYMARCIGLCVYLGVVVDHRWHTEPAGTLVGFGLGTAAAFYGLFREVARLGRKHD